MLRPEDELEADLARLEILPVFIDRHEFVRAAMKQGVLSSPLAGRRGLGETRDEGSIVLVHEVRRSVVVASELADRGGNRNASLVVG